MAIRKSRINKRALREARLRRSFRGVGVSAFNRFEEDDVIESDVAKSITSALWSNNVSTLTYGNFYTSSVQTASAAGGYQYEVYSQNPQTNASASVQFSIAYGHYAGSGSVTASGASNQGNTPSKAVYTSFANQLLAAGDDKFTIDSADQDFMYFITVQRERYKEKVNPGGWELRLKNGSKTVHLIDDSKINSNSTSNGNRVFNIISGTLATGQSLTTANHGLFYPDLGILAIATKVINDNANSGGDIGDNTPDNMSLAGASTTDQVLAMYTAISGSSADGGYFAARAEEDITSTHYFVRVKNSEYNFSNNPTFSTTTGQIQNASMQGDPSVYITTVGLYNDENELVATAKLSKPLLKSFAREATIRVKLDY